MAGSTRVPRRDGHEPGRRWRESTKLLSPADSVRPEVSDQRNRANGDECLTAVRQVVVAFRIVPFAKGRQGPPIRRTGSATTVLRPAYLPIRTRRTERDAAGGEFPHNGFSRWPGKRRWVNAHQGVPSCRRRSGCSLEGPSSQTDSPCNHRRGLSGAGRSRPPAPPLLRTRDASRTLRCSRHARQNLYHYATFKRLQPRVFFTFLPVRGPRLTDLVCRPAAARPTASRHLSGDRPSRATRTHALPSFRLRRDGAYRARAHAPPTPGLARRYIAQGCRPSRAAIELYYKQRALMSARTGSSVSQLSNQRRGGVLFSVRKRFWHSGSALPARGLEGCCTRQQSGGAFVVQATFLDLNT